MSERFSRVLGRKSLVHVNTYVKGLAAAVLLFIVPLEIILRDALERKEGDWLVSLQGKITSEHARNFFKAASLLGNRWVYLGLSPFLIHCVDPLKGLKIVLVAGFAMYCEGVLGLIYYEPRPGWVRDDIRVQLCEGGFGMPSASLVLFSVLAVYLLVQYMHKTNYIRVIAYVSIVLISLLLSFAKMYLGVNFPHQVVITLCYIFVYVTAALALDQTLTKLVRTSAFDYQENKEIAVYWIITTLFFLLFAIAIYDIITLNRTLNIKYIKNANLNCSVSNDLGAPNTFEQTAYIFYNLGAVTGCLQITKFRPRKWWKTALWKRFTRAFLMLGLTIGLFFMLQAIPMDAGTCSYVFRFAVFNFVCAWTGTAGLSFLGMRVPLFKETDESADVSSRQLVDLSTNP